MTILVCAFKAGSARSLSYRKYTTKHGATKAILKIFVDGQADYISVRIIREELNAHQQYPQALPAMPSAQVPCRSGLV